MSHSRSTWRHTLAAAFAALAVAAGTAAAQPPAPAYAPPYVKSSLVQVDVYDRVDGAALPVHQKDGRHYIVGVPGHEYAVRIRNCTGCARPRGDQSVDGVNVISGDTAAPGQSGYVLDPWGSVEIAGWRKSLDRTAAFYFTDLGDSYAARTGRPQNVGVIGVAVFQEKPKRIVYREKDLQDRLAAAEAPAPIGQGRTPGLRRRLAAAGRERRCARQRAESTRAGRHAQRAQAARQARHRSRPQRGLARDADAVRARDVVARGDGRHPVRPAREPGRAGRAARSGAAVSRGASPNPFPATMRFAPDPDDR